MPKYVNKSSVGSSDKDSIEDSICEWMVSQAEMQEEYLNLVEMILDEGGGNNG